MEGRRGARAEQDASSQEEASEVDHDEAADEGDAAGEGETTEGSEGDPSRSSAPATELAEPAADLAAWWRGAPMPRLTALTFGLVVPAFLLFANMWRVRAFTIDDAYISFRYARNLARGAGLVYNAGERIEGYTNFLWTVILAGAIELHLDPDLVAKVLGGACALGALGMTYLLAERFRPFGTVPCVATWLLASTIVFSGYAVFGLETSLLLVLILGGTWLMLREADRDREGAALGACFPWSGAVFALAGLTRPEAPMFVGLLMLFLGRRILGAQNLVRGALFALPIAAHVVWRHAYYGTWLPNTLSAKTGNLNGQIGAGWGYIQNYVQHAGPFVWLALFGVASGVFARRRDVLAVAAIAAAVLGYVTLVGGDWMPFFRFMAPFEPFCFLLVDLAVRTIADRRDRAANLALAAFVVVMAVHRVDAIDAAQRQIIQKEDHFWRGAAGGTARWLLSHGDPGELALGDIGYVGYATDYPILDLLGLVDPVISKLPGGYTRKLGPGFTQRFFDKLPKYALIISSNIDCEHPSVPGSQVLFNDRRFRPAYAIAGKVPLDGGFAWCIYERRP